MPVLGQIKARPAGANPNIDWATCKAFCFGIMGYKVYCEEARDFHLSEAPVRVISAPARTSKSMAAAHDIIPYGMPTEPLTSSLHWIIGPTYETNKEFDYLWERLVDEREKWSHKGAQLRVEKARNNPGNGDMIIVLNHGADKSGKIQRAVFRGMSSTNERALQGEEVTTAILSEAAEHPEHILRKYLSTRCWKIILPTTPKAKAEHIRDMIERGQKNPETGIESWRFPRHANPLYDWERYHREKLIAELTHDGDASQSMFFLEQFEGEWVFYTGMVLPFDRTKHIVGHDPEDLEHLRKFVSLDYGYDHPAVAIFWAVLPDGRLFIFDEVSMRKKDTPQFVSAISEKIERVGGFDYVVGDPARPEVASIFRREHDFPVWDRDKNAMRDRAAGHRMLVDLLSVNPDTGVPGLVVHERCEKLIHEWTYLRYKEGAQDEYAKGAFDSEDDFYDAGRYGVMTRPRAKPEPKKRDWYREFEQRRRRRYANQHPLAASFGASRWAATGVNPYG